MRTILFWLALISSALPGRSATTINPANKYAYGANIGWIDWRGDANSGAAIGDYVCSGYIYSANVGWINLGAAAPTNHIRYQNLSTNDFGVNHDGLGNLRGYAWGANIGWINFEATGAPKVNLVTGKLCGYAYSANCGWLSLSNSFAFVQTDTFYPGPDLDADGLADPWEYSVFTNLVQNAGGDPDGDGMNNSQEYLAGTDPTDANSNLKIVDQAFMPGGTFAGLRWTTVPSRVYHIERALDLRLPAWSDSVLGTIAPDPGDNTARVFADTNAPVRFYRIRAARPLTP